MSRPRPKPLPHCRRWRVRREILWDARFAHVRLAAFQGCRPFQRPLSFMPKHCSLRVRRRPPGAGPCLSVVCQTRSCTNIVSCPLKSHIQPDGLKCSQCNAVMGIASVQTQLEVQIREHIAKYYESWTICDDATCGNRTRMMGVYGRRCLRPGCRGTVAFEVSLPI